MRSGNAEQLVIDPDVGDRLGDVLPDRSAGLAEQRRELRDRELRASGASNPISVRAERVLQAGASRECKRRDGGNCESAFHIPCAG